jgi:hypothetical protein
MSGRKVLDGWLEHEASKQAKPGIVATTSGKGKPSSLSLGSFAVSCTTLASVDIAEAACCRYHWPRVGFIRDVSSYSCGVEEERQLV